MPECTEICTRNLPYRTRGNCNHSRWCWHAVLVGGPVSCFERGSWKCSICARTLGYVLVSLYNFQRNGVLTISIEVLPVHIRRLIQRVDVNSITIEVGPCRDAAASFDMANLSSQVGFLVNTLTTRAIFVCLARGAKRAAQM